MSNLLLHLMCGSRYQNIPGIFLDFFDDISLAYITLRISREAPEDDGWFSFNPYMHMDRKEADRALQALCDLNIIQQKDGLFLFDADLFYNMLSKYAEEL